MKKDTFVLLENVLAILFVFAVCVLFIGGVVWVLGLTPSSIPHPLLWVMLFVCCYPLFYALVIGIGWLVKKSDENYDEYRERLRRMGGRTKLAVESVSFTVFSLAFIGIAHLILEVTGNTWADIFHRGMGTITGLSVLSLSFIFSKLIAKKFWKG